jgi:5S rRNA maturation endonuclease (ribonuclease M5)
MTEQKELLDLAHNQIPQLLTLLGIEYRQSGKYLISTCNVHHGDNRGAFAWNIESNSWRCFTHQCQEDWGHTIIGLVSGILQYSYDDAVAWIAENIHETNVVIKKTERKEDPIFPEISLQRLFKTDFYLKKGFLASTLNDFEHGKAESKNMIHRVVFPIRDENKYIRGFSGRWAGKEIEKGEKTVCVSPSGREVPKWKHMVSKTNYLYNWYRAKDFSKQEIIIVESIGNVMRWWEAGFKNIVACLGSSLSPRQCQLIVGKTNSVILAFDNDKAGQKATKKSIKQLEEYMNVKELYTPDDRDWGEISAQEIQQIYGQNIRKSL